MSPSDVDFDLNFAEGIAGTLPAAFKAAQRPLKPVLSECGQKTSTATAVKQR
jgi:hypothetical protein